MTPICNGKVEAGARLWTYEKKKFTEYLKSLEEQEVEIIVRKRKDTRTLQQMRYYWGVVVKIIADDTGNDPDDVHEFLKEKFAPKKVIGIKNEKVVAGCTHDPTKDNFFTDFIDKIVAWYTQEGGYIPPPPSVDY